MAFCVQLLKLIHSSLRSLCITFELLHRKPLIILYVRMSCDYRSFSLILTNYPGLNQTVIAILLALAILCQRLKIHTPEL